MITMVGSILDWVQVFLKFPLYFAKSSFSLQFVCLICALIMFVYWYFKWTVIMICDFWQCITSDRCATKSSQSPSQATYQRQMAVRIVQPLDSNARPTSFYLLTFALSNAPALRLRENARHLWAAIAQLVHVLPSFHLATNKTERIASISWRCDLLPDSC